MTSDVTRAAAIIVAGGTGDRFGTSGGKQLASVAGLPVLSHTLRAFDLAQTVGLLVVVCHPDRIAEFRSEAVDPLELRTPWTLVGGGSSRMDSVRNGLAAVEPEWPYVMVHDGARPLILPQTIDDALRALREKLECQGVVVGHLSYDTIKEVSANRIISTPDRSRFWVVQTPQIFRARAIRGAYESSTDGSPTDDASLVEAAGGRVDVVEGPRDNIKVTVAEDLAIVEAVLRYREIG